MRAHILQHVPFEGLGSIEPWLARHGYITTTTRFYESGTMPEINDLDLLIILGGPMSVKDEAEFPWLKTEKAFVRAIIEAGKAVLGICLGAQLIADAMGGRVYKNSVKEIGWFPLQGLSSQAGIHFPATGDVFHWHGETFDLPPGAVLLARSEGCENQAFLLGDAAIGLQFHLETTPETARQIVEHCREELVPGQYIQDEQTILAASPERYLRINALLDEVLEYLHGKIA